MSGDRTEAIGAAVEPILVAAGYDLEEVVLLTPPGRRDVRVVIDKDGGAPLDELADLSRELGAVLDAADVMGEQHYELELTTPGIGRQLTRPRHWRRAAGRTAKIEYTVDGSAAELTGRIGALDGADAGDPESVTVVKADKGRISTVNVPLAAVTSAVVDVDFRRPGEAELRACGLDDAEIARRRTPNET
ncbi:ribosome maturation factor RimP [Gordonia zhaorongruii]|uniref:ribosome maturation factor RimP n=1 Tax=Gordonia zhaorongruii TaxID=2597659 RepID=UPI0010478B75|nr:ribosome maturation factor RimP [Gordonia zhaorongruii]